MKLKKEVKSWNNYLPPPPPLIRLTLHQRTITHGCEIVQWDYLIPKILIVSEIKPD